MPARHQSLLASLSFIVLVSIPIVAAHAHAISDQSVTLDSASSAENFITSENHGDFTWANRALARWRNDSRSFMNELPQKTHVRGTFAAANAARLFAAKAEFRSKIIASASRRSNGLRSGITDVDRPEDLIEPATDASGHALPILDHLEDMQAGALLTATLPTQPWSDSYWPVYQGGLAARYAAPGFPSSSKDWREFERFSHQNVTPDDLSPFEKYEMLVGGTHALSNQMWDLGRYYMKQYGKVEDWIGICNGWSYASFSMPRPRHSLKLKTKDSSGREVELTFFPQDIKALGSYMWSSPDQPYRFIGTKCSEKNPPQDANGRIDPKFPECVDTNPGTWHQTIVNQLGVRKRSFIFDSAYDYEVWNYPLTSYRYTYFNPQTGSTVATLADATVSIGFSGDKYARYRDPKARKVVGIAMNATYIDEQDPSHQSVDSEAADVVSDVHYLYDLELDESGKIIGGEWYQNAHPDFMWTLPTGTRPHSSADDANADWDGQSELPPSIQRAAATAAENGEVLPAIVERLFQMSVNGSAK